jgi:hypothetical protein
MEVGEAMEGGGVVRPSETLEEALRRTSSTDLGPALRRLWAARASLRMKRADETAVRMARVMFSSHGGHDDMFY